MKLKFVRPTLVFFYLVVSQGWGQSIPTFTLADFDLKNRVKSCLISTSYGVEEYDFDRNGLLIKSVTRFNDKDYHVIHYKYVNGKLKEKRSESYRNDVFDASTSIAHFYEIDSTKHLKIQERIFTYDKEFLDEYVYEYNAKDVLTTIRRTNNQGTDVTRIERKKEKGEFTTTHMLNGEPLKSVRISTIKPKNRPEQKIVLTKEFLKGQASAALEEVYDKKGRLMAKQAFEFNTDNRKFEPTVRTSFTYDDLGILISETSTSNKETLTKAYVYHYDAIENGNWVKKISTPDNIYISRKILYYEPIVEVTE